MRSQRYSWDRAQLISVQLQCPRYERLDVALHILEHVSLTGTYVAGVEMHTFRSDDVCTVWRRVQDRVANSRSERARP